MDRKADLKDRVQAVNDRLHKVLKKEQYRQKNDPIVIPVVVHVVWFNEVNNIATRRIHDQMRVLNEVFTNTHEGLRDIPDNFKPLVGNPQLKFCLAAEDPQGNPTEGIIRTQTSVPGIGGTNDIFYSEFGGSTAWDTERYLNIWITDFFGRTGYAFYPNEGDIQRDGIVLWADVVQVGSPVFWGNGRVAVHEIGHYLGLRHIWGTDTSPMLDSECQNDDGIADTPLQHLPSGFCPTSAADRPHTCGSPDMFVNYMDYTEDACLNMFTKQQVTVMHTVLQEFRPRLIEGKIKYHPVPPQRDFTPFFVYPNPTTDRFFVDFDAYGDERSRITIELYNINGRLILSKKVNKEVRVEVLVTNLPKGIYLVKVGDTVKKLFRS